MNTEDTTTEVPFCRRPMKDTIQMVRHVYSNRPRNERANRNESSMATAMTRAAIVKVQKGGLS